MIKNYKDPDNDFGANISILIHLDSDTEDFDMMDIQDETLF